MRCALLDNSAKTRTVFSLGLLSLGLLVFTLAADPIFIALRFFSQVTKGSFVEEMLKREMEGIHVLTYLFNITNAEAFMAGVDKKLKVEEIGPFKYKEFRINKDIEIDSTAGLMRYTPTIRTEFIPEESIGDPHKIHVTMPNLPMLGLATTLTNYPGIFGSVYNLLTRQVNSKAVINISVHDYLWGYEEPLISIAHKLLPGFIKFDKMGLLARVYDLDRRTRVEISIANKDKFMVKSVNHYKRLQMGEFIDPDTCAVCNTFDNVYEGFGFPLQITPDVPIRLFRTGLCRIVDLDFYETTTTDYGAEAFLYHINDNFFTLDPNKYSNGVVALPDCFYGVPLAFSKPNFLDSDPSVYERVEGMKPDNKTRGYVFLDPRLGLSLEAVLSLQLNLAVGDISASHQARSFSDMVLPVCYLTIEQPSLPNEAKMLINYVYYIGPNALLASQILLVIVTVFTWGHCVRSIYRNLAKRDDTVMSFPSGKTLDDKNAHILEPLMKDISLPIDKEQEEK